MYMHEYLIDVQSSNNSAYKIGMFELAYSYHFIFTVIIGALFLRYHTYFNNLSMFLLFLKGNLMGSIQSNYF